TQSDLVRPSQLTPQRVSILYSNLTEPSSQGGDTMEMEYGARFAQAAVAAGCAGGSRSTNAKRRVLLVQTNRLTGESKTIDRPVEALLKNPTDNGENPFLMPQDSLVCYDSTVTNVSGVLRIISNVFSPFFLIRDLFSND
ncbi:polysaccharide export protein, partial [Leptolyngbya sp. FACHB-36]|nr:polysaccharide export protein [Leptolyngbya sp. FACHB-36]